MGVLRLGSWTVLYMDPIICALLGGKMWKCQVGLSALSGPKASSVHHRMRYRVAVEGKGDSGGQVLSFYDSMGTGNAC